MSTDPRYKRGIHKSNINQPSGCALGDSPLRHGWRVLADYPDGGYLWGLAGTGDRVKMRLYRPGVDPVAKNVDWVVFFDDQAHGGYAGGLREITASVRLDFAKSEGTKK